MMIRTFRLFAHVGAFCAPVCSTPSRRLFGSLAVSCTVAILMSSALAVSSFGGTVSYGNFFGDSVDYLNVQEHSSKIPPLPALYGAPTLVGDSLFFSPQQFLAESNNNVPPIDTTDGQLTMIAMAHPGEVLQSISFDESGLFEVSGFQAFNTDDTSVRVLVVGFVTVLEIDGDSNIVPLPIQLNLAYEFTPQSPAGPPVATNQWLFLTNGDNAGSWSAGQDLNITQALVAAGRSFQFGATKVDINIDNRLRAKSEPGGSAYIDKKLFLEITTTVPVPEPTSVFLFGVGLLGLIATRRRALGSL
jgi:hypothetical protein